MRGIAALLLVVLLATIWVIRPSWLPWGGPREEPEPTAAKPVATDGNGAGHPRFVLAELQATPIQFEPPSYLYVEVRNDGHAAGNVDLWMELDGGQFQRVLVQPSPPGLMRSGGAGEGVVRVVVPEVAPGQSVHVYALTTAPRFRRIVLGQPSGPPTEVTYEASKGESNQIMAPWMWTIVRIILTVFLVVGAIFMLPVIVWIIRGLPYMLSEPTHTATKPDE